MAKIKFTIDIDKELHKRFKLWCTRHDTSMSKEIIAYIDGITRGQ